MTLIIATSNKGKIKEINDYFSFHNLCINAIAYSEIIQPFEIEENGSTFAENALIKAYAISQHIPNEWVLADDSGISVPALNYEPGIYSARYAGLNANDAQNRAKMIEQLNQKNLQQTPAYYTAALSLVKNSTAYTVHGWTYGSVINQEKGEGGFGYDPLFVPQGYEKTLGELPIETKIMLSHRSKALELIMIILRSIS